MTLSKPALAALCLPLLAPACAPSPEGSPDAEPERPDAARPRPEGDHARFVVDSIVLPTTDDEAAFFGLDLDGDGDVDNRLGSIISVLNTGGADLNGQLAEQVDRGDVIELADLQAASLLDAEAAGLYVWKGGDPSPAPCADLSDTVCRRHLDGAGAFTVTATNPDDTFIYGRVTAGHFSGGSGFIELDVPLFISPRPLHLELVGARAEVDVAATGLSFGKLAGALSDAFIQAQLIPQLHVVFGEVVAEDCGGTAPTCCTPGSNGEQAIDIFDADGSCTLELQELYDNGLLDALLAPDVDLLDQEGFLGPDGTLDSVSLGLAFTAAPATYDIPAGL